MKLIRRTKYLINGRLQLAVTFQLTYVMLAMGVIHALALSLIPASTVYDMSGPEVLQVLMMATAAYFILTTAILWLLAIVSTNRIAGPVYVIREALIAMHKGDYSKRVSLRRRDHLKEVAATVADMQNQLRGRDEKLRELRSCLLEGDQNTALGLLDLLGVVGVQVNTKAAEPVAAS